MERLLNQLVEKLARAYGDRLVSVILYGSAAVGDHQGRYSDINIFCALSQVTARELADSAAAFAWWRELGNPAPLLMSCREIRESADCFPIEFHDIQERRRLLHGEDVMAGVRVDDRYYRALVEHELRAKLLRLRQKAAGVLDDRTLLLRLMAGSLSTFCVLARHVLRLRGLDAPWTKRDIVERAAEALGVDARAFRTLLDLREERVKPRDIDARALLESYLEEIATVIDAAERPEN